MKNTYPSHLFIIAFASLFLSLSFSSTLAQINYNYPISGPYSDHPGPYYIRVIVNFQQSTTNQWTNNWNIKEEAEAAMVTLNTAFNKHSIYFVPYQNYCDESFYQVFTTDLNVLEFRAQLQDPSQLDAALNIYVIDDDGDIAGFEFYTPNNFLQVNGKRNGVLVTRSEMLAHETGHILGLVHTFTGAAYGGCDETPENCGPEGDCACESEAFCNCCGDYVCDTDPFYPVGSVITANSNCTHATLPEHIVRNFMSYTVPGECRNMFTPEQARRMRTYLESAPVLQGVQIKPVQYPGAAPATLSGNIIVNSGELVVDSPLEMLPGSIIRVKPGAELRVASTITGACEQMWQGVIVEGTTFASQTTTNQGKVTVTGAGKLKHARIAIDVQDTDSGGIPLNNTGGGIVQVVGGQLIDNIIGIRYGPYVYFASGEAQANTSVLFWPQFSVTDEYRGGTVRPVFMELDGAVRLNIRYGRFLDLRTLCSGPASRAIGIDSKNAGFRVSGGKFENLYFGIRANQLNENNGSFSITGSDFIACFREVYSLSTSGFSITGNDFIVEKPAFCPSSSELVIGVQIIGHTTGFRFSDNSFSYGGQDTPAETLIGTDCQNLGEGLNNTVFGNSYTNLDAGNRAGGINRGADDGLLYLCNTNFNALGAPSDFKITQGGSIWEEQADKDLSGNNLPTGNVFSDFGYTIENDGDAFTYFYDSTGAGYFHNPAIGLGIHGSGMVNTEPLQQSNENCAEPDPCMPPCPEEVANAWKARFHINKEEWVDKLSALPYITDSMARAQGEEAVRNLRLAMNKDGRRILLNYTQDTTAIQIDSIVTWLENIETYPADLRLSRHYFFIGNFSAFDQLWQQIETGYDLGQSAQEEFDRLDEVYALLRNHAGGNFTRLSQPALDSLREFTAVCDEAGYLSQAVLWINRIWVEPECEAMEERSGLTQLTETPSSTPFSMLKVYPNPANESLTIKYPRSAEQTRFRLFDLYGRIIYESMLSAYSQEATFSIDHLASGIYLAEIRWGSNSSGRVKVVIAR